MQVHNVCSDGACAVDPVTESPYCMSREAEDPDEQAEESQLDERRGDCGVPPEPMAEAHYCFFHFPGRVPQDGDAICDWTGLASVSENHHNASLWY